MRLNWYITVFFISGCCAGGSDLNEEFWSQFEDNEMLAINPAESTEQRHFTDALNEELPFQDLAADELFWDQFQHNLELPPPARSSSPLLDTIGDYTYPSWLIEDPEDVTSHPSQLMATQPVDLIPQTPGTLLTNALGDLNFLSPSVFSADTNPFDTLFGTLSVPISAPTRIQNSGVEFLGPTLPIIPSTSPEHIPPDDTPIFEPPSRAATPEAGASHIQDGKIAKPRSRHRINRTPSDSGQVIRGRSIPNKKTKDRPWQCDQCQRAFGRQGKFLYLFCQSFFTNSLFRRTSEKTL